MIQEFDLHTHTINSDGEYTTKELVNKIKESNIKIFSITDHDSIQSVKEIKKINIKDLKYIKGIEFSSIYNDEYNMHILGYNIDENNTEILEIIKNIKQKRINRIYDMTNHLNKEYNIILPKEEIEKIIKENNIPGRVHIGKLLVKYNYAKDMKDSFNKFLEDIDNKTIIAREDAEKVIKAIKNAGGIAIWAHPKKTEQNHNMNIEEILQELIDLGLDGIEAYNSLHTYEESQRYIKIAKKYNILVSGGSDYHGPNTKPNVLLGKIYKDNNNCQVETNQINILDILLKK
jgi:3',5'-nucleoside bisphosphate phosphatase